LFVLSSRRGEAVLFRPILDRDDGLTALLREARFAEAVETEQRASLFGSLSDYRVIRGEGGPADAGGCESGVDSPCDRAAVCCEEPKRARPVQ
jgi:hypothetical protein